MDNRCVICGEIIPEGREVCPACEKGLLPDVSKEKADLLKLPDGN